MSAEHRPRLVVAVTDPLSAILVRGQLRYFNERGFDVALLSGPGGIAEEVARSEGVRHLPVPMRREIAPWQDLKSLLAVARVLRRERPQVVNAGTPKAGLVVTAAAFLCGVPCRVYTLRGLRVDTERGAKRLLLTTLERLTAAMAHRVVCISPSLRRRAIDLGVVGAGKAMVFGSGSSNGIDTRRFSTTPERERAARELRASLGIGAGEVVVGFVGRVVRDKGIEELVGAWRVLRERHPGLRLLVVGPLEAGDPISPESERLLRSDPRVVLAGQVNDPAVHYLAMDVVAIPTHREGFGNALMEANALGRPVVSCRVAGCVDAVKDGETALLVPPGDAEALSEAIARYVVDPALRRAHGEAGRRRVLREFGQETLWAAMHAEYRRLLARRGTVLPEPGAEPASGVGPDVVRC